MLKPRRKHSEGESVRLEQERVEREEQEQKAKVARDMKERDKAGSELVQGVRGVRGLRTRGAARGRLSPQANATWSYL